MEVSGFSGNLRMTGADNATPPPFRSKGSGTFRMGTYNIITGQGGGILSALRAMGKLGVDVGVLQETKMTKGIYPRQGFGYSVFCSDAPSRQCGGVALFWRDCDGCVLLVLGGWWAGMVVSARGSQAMPSAAQRRGRPAGQAASAWTPTHAHCARALRMAARCTAPCASAQPRAWNTIHDCEGAPGGAAGA